MTEILFIAGTPGTGKTTLGRILSEKTGLKFIEIRELIGHNKLDVELEIDARTLSIRAGKMLRRLSSKSLVATHIAFKPRGVNVERVFVLRRDPFMVISSLRDRGYLEDKVLENAEAEFLGVVYFEMLKKFGPEKTWQINISKRSIDEAVNLLVNGINGVNINEEVDWMSTFEKDGRLDELLALFSKRLKSF